MGVRGGSLGVGEIGREGGGGGRDRENRVCRGTAVVQRSEEVRKGRVRASTQGVVRRRGTRVSCQKVD